MATARAKKHTSGRQQRKATPTAQARQPNLARFYRYKLPPIHPGDFSFHLDLLRPKRPPLSLDRMVDTLSWDDEQSTLTGSVTAYRPDPEDPSTLPVTRGQLVRCRVRWAGGMYQLWTMRVGAVQPELETGNVTIPLQDDMALLDGGKRDWWYRKTKHRPHGWRADEIARDVARTLGVKVRKLAKGTHRMEVKLKGVSGLSVLQKAYANEKDHAGRSFIIRLRNGELEVVPLARNPNLYVLGRALQTAQITQKAGQTVPTTVLTGRGKIGKGKATKSVSFTEYNRRVVNQLGYVHDTHDFGPVASMADLKGKVKRELAKRLRLNDTITLTHQGIPFILRGDGIELNLPKEGYAGEDAFVFCTRANHTVQAGVYTSSLDFHATDPYLGAGDPASKAVAQNPKKQAKKAASRRAAKRVHRPRPKLRRK